MKLPLDIENLIMKVYSHFSTSAKRVENLKSCYEYTETNFRKLIKHIPTLWLTLCAAIERMINNLDCIRSYFIGINQEELPNIIVNFIWGESESNLLLSEMFFQFSFEYMKIFNQAILTLEKTSINSTQVYDIMFTVKTKLNNRLKLKFFGSDLNGKMNKLTVEDKNIFETQSLYAYSKALDYLKNWFDFDNSIFKNFTYLNLEKPLDFYKVKDILKNFNLNVDKTALFDEISDFNENKYVKIGEFDKSLANDELWAKLLNCKKFPNLHKIVECVLSVPISNAFVERIFSIMKNLWTDERNCLSVGLVKAEICTKVNFNMKCHEFAEYVSKKENILKAAKSNSKYKFV